MTTLMMNLLILNSPLAIAWYVYGETAGHDIDAKNGNAADTTCTVYTYHETDSSSFVARFAYRS